MHKNQVNAKSFISLLKMDPLNQKCIDKVEVVSLVHGTGHILVITKSGKQFRVKLSDLISELKTDQDINIVKSDRTIFENIVKFRYSANPEDPTKIDRSAEFDKIVQQAKLKILGTDQPDIMKSTNCVEVKVQLDNVTPDLIQFYPIRSKERKT
jgi:hypothetical protein